MPKVLNVKSVEWPLPADCVYVGRNAKRGDVKWGNPFKVVRDGTRVEVIAKYRDWIVQQPDRMAELPELCGKDLVCHCAPLPCHAEVLLELANRD
jgi:hypothetical protein